MPTISTFYGILIQMFWNDHAPPHFHALYAEHEVLIDVRTLEVMEGQMPRGRWLLCSNGRRNTAPNSCLEDWELCAHNQSPKKIRPLP